MKEPGSSPYYSILIPTKNRSHLVGYALRSVLGQDFTDFEIILCDNDDDETATREAVGPFLSDPRVRYVRTGGLGMVENWNRALDEAAGRYITVLEDKMVFYPGALGAIRKKIEQSPSGVVVWNTDRVRDDSSPAKLVRFTASSDRILKSEKVLALLAEDMMKHWRLLPRGLSCVVPHELISRITANDGKPFYEPLSPDFVSALKVVNSVDDYMLAGGTYALIVSNSASNGKAVLLRKEGEDALKYYGGSKELTLELSYVPVKSLQIVVNTVVDDYRALVSRGYTRLARYPVSQASYVNMMARELVSTTLSAGKVIWKRLEIQQLLRSDGGYVLNAIRIMMAVAGMLSMILLRRLGIGRDRGRVVVPIQDSDIDARIEQCIRIART